MQPLCSRFYCQGMHQKGEKRARRKYNINVNLVHNIFVSFLSDPSPIIGYACHSLTNSLTHSCLVDLMADTKCMRMSQQLLKAVKSFLRLKKVV